MVSCLEDLLLSECSIAIKKGVNVYVSEEDHLFLLVMYPNIWLGAKSYPMLHERQSGRSNPLYLHHFIAKRMKLVVPDGMTIDHEDRNKLNCCRWNLRVATYSQNNANSCHKGNKHGYKGVYKQHKDRWVSDITVNGQKHYLGSYDSVELAAAAYDAAALRYFGHFSRGNL